MNKSLRYSLLSTCAAALLAGGTAISQAADDKSKSDMGTGGGATTGGQAPQMQAPSTPKPADDAGSGAASDSGSGAASGTGATATAGTAESSTVRIVSSEEPGQLRAEKLIGMKVINAEGEELGTVDDILFSEDGRMKGLILESGGVLGIGAKSVGVEVPDLHTVAAQGDSLTIDLAKQELEDAPAFQKLDEMKAGDGGVTPPAGTTGSTGMTGSTRSQ